MNYLTMTGVGGMGVGKYDTCGGGGWGARMAARTAQVSRGAAEEIGQFWRRLHKTGHRLLHQLGWSGGAIPGDVVCEVLRRLCRLAVCGSDARCENTTVR